MTTATLRVVRNVNPLIVVIPQSPGSTTKSENTRPPGQSEMV